MVMKDDKIQQAVTEKKADTLNYANALLIYANVLGTSY